MITFPSPCGDYGSYLRETFLIAQPPKVVSVPLRGLWFLSRRKKMTYSNLKELVSVPFRVLWFLSSCVQFAMSVATSVSVPLRGLWFLSQVDFLTNRLIKEHSPSPCGDYGSDLLFIHFVHLINKHFLIPSPCGDYGSYLRTLYRWLYEAVEMAFCGADHIFSSFFVFCKKMIFKKSFRLEF